MRKGEKAAGYDLPAAKALAHRPRPQPAHYPVEQED
jgi:hypothetical protein